MNADVLTARVADGIAVITLGSARRIYFDEEMGDALTEALDGFAGDANVRVVVVTGGAPGYFIRHFSVAALIRLAESLRASGREWPENATYNRGFFDKAMALCESMSKPVIAAISGTCLAGTRTKSLLEIVHYRTCTRAHAFLCRGEHHLAVALYRGRSKERES
jgi:enoyl-CoA hydratase/carnithine racemase